MLVLNKKVLDKCKRKFKDIGYNLIWEILYNDRGCVYFFKWNEIKNLEDLNLNIDSSDQDSDCDTI